MLHVFHQSVFKGRRIRGKPGDWSDGTVLPSVEEGPHPLRNHFSHHFLLHFGAVLCDALHIPSAALDGSVSYLTSNTLLLSFVKTILTEVTFL